MPPAAGTWPSRLPGRWPCSPPEGTSPTGFLTGTSLATNLAFDPHGNLFVASAFGSSLTEFAPGSTTPTASLSGTSDPQGLAFDAGGNLFVSDASTNTVLKYAPGSTSPTATLTGLNQPGTLAFDSNGNLFVINSNGTVSKFAPGATTPTAALTGLSQPGGLAGDADGNLFVSNSGNGTISEFPSGATTPTATLTGLNGNGALAFDPSGNLFVVSRGANSVAEFTPGSTAPTSTVTGLSQPLALSCDAQGHLYAVNWGNSTVSEFTSSAERVRPATPTVTVADAGGTYNGQAFPATAATVTGVGADGVIARLGDPSLSYTYYQNGVPLAGAPVNAGSYAVVAHFAGSANYTAAASAEAALPGSPGDPQGLYGDNYGHRSKAGLVLEAGKSMAYVTAIDVLDLHPYDGPGGTHVETAPAGSPYSYLLRNMNDGAGHDVTLGVVEATPFTIIQATPTVQVSDAGGTYNGSPFPATSASVVGVGSDGVIASFGASSLSYTYCQNGTALAGAPVSAGSYTMVAHFGGNANYSAADSAATPFTIQKATPTITWASPADITYGTALGAAQLNATASWTVGGVPGSVAGTFTYAQHAGTVLHAGSGQTLSVTFTPTDTTDYNTATWSVQINVGKATLTVQADAQSKFYGQSDPALSYQVSGLQSTDTAAGVLSGGLARAAGEHVGSYAINQGTLAADSDYTIAFTSASLAITPATLTVTANPQARVYGQANPPLTAGYSGFVNGDTAAVLGGSPSLATSAGLYSPVGSYPITVGAGSLNDPDYVFTFINGNLAVNKASTVTALTTSSATLRFGVDTVTFTAAVTASAPGGGTATGSVDFYDTTAGTDLGTAPVVNGTASLSTGALAVGKHAITATYGGGGNFLGSASAAVTEQVLVRYTPGVFDPTTATWYLRDSNSAGAPNIAPFQYGAPGWAPVVGDWNGDGTTTIGVVDPATMTWYLRNEDSAGAPDVAAPFRYGLPGWVPVVGDWGGTGHFGIGAFDPSTGTWYLRNEASAGAPDAGVFRYGAAGWVPVVGDWDGNGTTTVGVVNPNGPNGQLQWFLRNSNSAGAPDIAPFTYGLSGWRPIAGDWTGQGKTTIGVVGPANDTWYLRNSNTPGRPDLTPFAYGGAGWSPVSGNWTGQAATALAAAANTAVNNNLVTDLLAAGVHRTRALDQVFASGSLDLG
jgi:hypothetical protein